MTTIVVEQKKKRNISVSFLYVCKTSVDTGKTRERERRCNRVGAKRKQALPSSAMIIVFVSITDH
jgi:hypothetical protein